MSEDENMGMSDLVKRVDAATKAFFDSRENNPLLSYETHIRAALAAADAVSHAAARIEALEADLMRRATGSFVTL